jgi:polysaccharide export outer membrane protein
MQILTKGDVAMANLRVSLCAWSVRAQGTPLNEQTLSISSGLLALSLLCSAVPAEAQYRVDVGDVIEIFVARVPELQRRIPIRLDGSISFPLLGSLAVAGLDSSEMESRIQATLASKVFQQRLPDGREVDVLLNRDEITAAVVEYRPIYVNGDVSRPGAHAYRPSMTARQAIALSGGYDVLRGGTTNPYFESADLRSDYESLWAEVAKEQAHVWRLKSELEVKDNLDQNILMDVPISRSTILQIANVEAEHLTMRQADYQRQRAFLQRSIKQGDEQISVLSEEQQKEDQGMRDDVEELRRVTEVFAKGALPSPRVVDARRAVLLSATRKLQTTAQIMQMKKHQDDLLRQMEKLDDQRKIDLLRELQEAGVKLAALRAKLQSVWEKLQFTMVRSQIVRGNETRPEITVIRKGEKGRERFIADEESELQPGDVIEVTVRLDYSARAPVR